MPELSTREGPQSEVTSRIDSIIHCPAGDSLRYPSGFRLWRRISRWIGRPYRQAAIRRAEADLDRLAASMADPLIIVGPGVDPHFAEQVKSRHRAVIDFSGPGLDGAADPKRRSLEEGWFDIAKPATDLALDEIIRVLPAPWADEVAAHRSALQLRLKMEIGLRLRRIEIVESAHTLASRPPVLIIEGDQPMDDVTLLISESGVRTEGVLAPMNSRAWKRACGRASGAQQVEADWEAFSTLVAAWIPPPADLGGKVLIAADLRRKQDFRHSRTALALMAEARVRGAKAMLVQPYTRVTRNVIRVLKAVRSRGAEVCLRRQPTSQAESPKMAGVRSLILRSLDTRMHELDQFTPGVRGAILEACGGFIISNLPQSLGLCRGMERDVTATPPDFVASVPLGSPFGALLISAAKRAGVPTIEIQTLMIGTSQRDPEPVAHKVAVLDTHQRDIFATRFKVPAHRFVLSGHVDLPNTPLPPRRDPSVLFASQPLDNVAVAALSLLAEGCARTEGAKLRVAPHPDETDDDLEAYRQVLRAWPDLDSAVLNRGSASAALPAHGVLATVVSNMALWAAAQERNVIVVEVAVPVPIDFAALGLASRAATPEEVSTLLNDFARGGPLSAALAKTRQQYFERNRQLRDGNMAPRIMDAMKEMSRNGNNATGGGGLLDGRL